MGGSCEWRLGKSREVGEVNWMFRNRYEVEQFLLKEFSEFNSSDVQAAFDWAFFEGNYEPSEAKKFWEPRLNAQRKARLSKSDAETLELEEIWLRSNPKTGGSDPADAILGDWVRMGFEDLGAKVSFGISADQTGQPSTRFGRVVEAALDWRRSSANWRRVAERARRLPRI